jgi:lipoprotein-anchoring transpeptidase ErfK/SrfK
MRRAVSALLFSCLLGLGLLTVQAPAEASVVARVSVARQQMSVYVNGALQYVWPVSTGRAGFSTPYGAYGVKRMARMHFSRKYDNAPMPYSIFFRGGYAVHGTGHVRALGRRASHGCVRLHPGNAAALFSLVQVYGPAASRVIIGN